MEIIAKVDSYNVKQYENERFVDYVILLEKPKNKYVLCYSKKYRANVLIPKNELFIEERG